MQSIPACLQGFKGSAAARAGARPLSTWQTIRAVQAENGFAGFYKGLVPALVLLINPAVQVGPSCAETKARAQGLDAPRVAPMQLRHTALLVLRGSSPPVHAALLHRPRGFGPVWTYKYRLATITSHHRPRTQQFMLFDIVKELLRRWKAARARARAAAAAADSHAAAGAAPAASPLLPAAAVAARRATADSDDAMQVVRRRRRTHHRRHQHACAEQWLSMHRTVWPTG